MNSGDFRLLVVGLDGATFDLMLPWIDQGLLPNLGRLVKEGSWSRLESTIPPVTPCAWSSFITGKNPGKHGLFDFVEPLADGHGFRFTNARSRHAESLWACLSRHGRRVGVVNVPMTYPPEPVNGYLISGLDTPHQHCDYSYPSGLRQELRDHSIPYRVDLRHLGDMRNDRRRARRLADLRDMETIRTDALQYLRQKYPTDFTMVVYIATDQVQHHFWHYMDPTHDKFDPQGAKRFGTAIRDVYIHLDQQIGRLLAELGDDTVVMVMSDHGFGPTNNIRLRLAQALHHEGLLTFKAEGRYNRLLRTLGGAVDAVARSMLSPAAKSLLAGMFPRLRVWFENVDEAKIDWSRTLAYVNEAYRASPALWLNRRDRNSQGVLHDAQEIEKVTGQIEAMLLSLKDPRTGNRVISQVHRAGDVYHGPYLSKAPDLIPSWWEDGFLLSQSDPRGSAAGIVERCDAKVVGGLEFVGSHRMDGVFIIHGGPTLPRGQFSGARIIDVAPTALYLMGIPIPDDMDGRPLVEVVDPGYVESHPVEYEQTKPHSAQSGRIPEELWADNEEQAVTKRLRALGYVD